VHNLLDVDFTDRGRWLYNHYIAFALRVDKKVLPAKLFKATLEKRLQAWCQENGRERVPRAVREEQKELLTEQMMARTLPRVAVTEACWNVVDGWVFFHTSSEAANDRFRKLFRATFGLGLEPASPLDFLADLPEVAAALEHTGLSDLRPDGEVSDVG
jgi:recombination associated protein RdgC